MHVGLLAGEQEQSVIGEPRAFIVENFEQGEGLGRFAPVAAKAVVELGEMDDSNPRFFEHVNKLWFLEPWWYALRFVFSVFLDELRRVLDVVVAREGLVSRDLRRTVAVGIGNGALDEPGTPVARGEPEYA